MGAKTKSNIDIFLRCRPVSANSSHFVADAPNGLARFQIPKDKSQGYVNNQREQYEFKFSGIIEENAKQDEVFERVARKTVQHALEGMNGTIFAYGQTGSGKTYTITGGSERYVDRGMIPRAISAIFSDLGKRSGEQFQVHVSYLEIYNNMGYDLLDPDREIKMLEDLPRVSLLEDSDGNFHLRNLSAHRATNEEEALNLLFLGDTNRTVSETPMNLASSRSHCIFTLYMESRKPGEETVRRSKLNLVDLAGSERSGKTGIEGSVFRESRFINVSLLFLEQVIIALQEQAAGGERQHVPYRSSLMTACLKDSLGGNCRTTMVATVNPSDEHLDESISTCRFAQRVAMISNEVSINEELDPMVVIKRLKGKVRDLQNEVRLLKGVEEDRGPLTQDELLRLKEKIVTYVEEPAGAYLDLGGSMMFINAAIDIFKGLAKGKGGGGGSVPGFPVPAGSVADTEETQQLQEQLRKLKLQVQQRDNEINILVSMLKKKGGSGVGKGAADRALLAGPVAAGNGLPVGHGRSGVVGDAPAGSGDGKGGVALSAAEPGAEDVLSNANLLADRNKAFELFRKSYRKNEVIEDNKALLKSKYMEAKALGQTVNEGKKRITSLKALIEQRRVERAMRAQQGEAEVGEADPEEDKAKLQIEREKTAYKASFERLRELKKEIEHVQLLLEQSRKRLQSDFEQWLQLMLRQQQKPAPTAASPAPSGLGAAAPSSAVSKRSLSFDVPPLGSGVKGTPGVSEGGRGLGSVDEAVLKQAAPLLTGNAEADRDIIKFIQARNELKRNQ